MRWPIFSRLCRILVLVGVCYVMPAYAAAPVTTSFSSGVTEDTTATVDLTPYASDADGDALTYYKATSAYSTCTVTTAGQATVRPATNYTGTGAYCKFYVRDAGGVISNVSRLSLTITAVNDAPRAGAQTAAVTEDTAKAITLAATDIDTAASSLIYSIVRRPVYGRLGTLSGNSVTYTPNANSTTADSFTFRVTDGALLSNVATVTLPITAVNDAPVAVDDALAATEDTAATFTASDLVSNDTDVEGSALTIASVTSGTGGTAVLNTDGTVSFTPSENFSGAANFSYVATDGSASSNVATANVTVADVNETPVATAQSVTVDEEGSVTITLAGTDADGDSLTYGLTSIPEHGDFSLSGDQVVYEPYDDYSGDDSFTFQAYDGADDATTAYSADATVSITVTAADNPPTSPVSVSVSEDADYPDNEIELPSIDDDGDTVTYSSCTDGTHGDHYYYSSLRRHTFTPDENYFGSDTFTCTASDGTTTVTVTVNVDVVAENDAPAVNSGHAYIDEGEETQFTLSASDVEDAAPSITLTGEPTLGEVSFSDPTITYVSNGTAGTDTFTYTVSDSEGSSSTATFTIYVGAENEPPTVSAVTGSGAEDSEITMTLLGADEDGDTLTYLVSASEDGTSEVDGETLSFTPADGFSGTATLAYYANDGQESSDAGTVTITVSGDNDAPVANDLAQTLGEDTTTTIVLSADDPEGETLTYQAYGSPAHGSVEIDGDTAVYDPEGDYYGSDSFTFTATDATGAVSNVATVSLTVRSAPDPTVTCSLTYDSAHVQTDAATELLYFDNLILVRFDHVATSAELDAVDAALTSAADSAEDVCRIEQEPLSADEISSSGLSLSSGDTDYGHYAFEIPVQSDLASLNALVTALSADGYAAMPLFLNAYENLAPATDMEALSASSSQSVPSAHKMIQTQGAWEYMRAYEAQGNPLHSITAGLIDSGVCASSEWFVLCGSTPSLYGILDSGILDEFAGIASAADPTTAFQLVDTDVNYHGTNVAYILSGASNGVKDLSGGLDPTHVDHGNGLLGGVHNFTESGRFTLLSYNYKMLANSGSFSLSPTEVYDAFVQSVIGGFNSLCATDVVNISQGVNIRGFHDISVNTSAKFADAAAACPAVYVFGAGNMATNLTADTDYAAEQLYAGFGSDTLIVQGTENDSTAASTWGTSSGSNTGGSVNIAAPLEYTSHAAPLVSGAVALLKAIDSSLSRSEIVSLITRSGETTASGAPLLDVASAALLAIEDEGEFVPMTITETKYTASPTLAELRSSEGFASGNHKETGWWRRSSNASDTLQIQRFSSEESLEGISSGLPTLDEDGYYTWSMKSDYYSGEQYKIGVAEISDSGRRVPVQVVQPKGTQNHILSGKYHAYKYAQGNPDNGSLIIEDHAQAYCFTLNYGVNGAEELSAGGFHVPLGGDSQSAAHTVPYKVAGATLTGNLVNKTYLYHHPGETWNEDLPDESSDTGDATGYANMAIPECDSDITSAYSENEGAFTAWLQSVEDHEYDAGTIGDWVCEETTVTTSTRNICPEGSNGFWWCDGRMQCTYGYNEERGIFLWPVITCMGDPVPTEVSSTSTDTSTEEGGCTGDEADTSSTYTSGNETVTTNCHCENVQPLTANCSVNSIWDSGSPWAPEEVETHTHIAVTFSGLENCQLSVAEENSSLTSGDVQNPSTGEWHDSFTYHSSGSSSCTATAEVTATTAYVREYVTGDDDCSLGSMERIGKQTDTFNVSVTWDFSQGEFPAKDIFTDIATNLETLMGTYESWLENAAGTGDYQNETWGAIDSPFRLVNSWEILFMPESLINARQVTPGFGLDMIDVQWSHGLGPVKRYGTTSDGRNFTWSASTRPSRSVGQ